MLNESSEKAHQLVALGLLARIFYASEPLGESRRVLACVCSHPPRDAAAILICPGMRSSTVHNFEELRKKTLW